MATSESSESLDSMDEDITQVPRARRSKVWEHYKPDLVNVDGDLKAVCKYCGAELQAKFGTSSLRSHIADSCRSIDDACRDRFLSTMKTTKPSEALFVFDPKVCRELMVKFCIHAEIPFLKFEDPYLQPWIDSMQPAFQVMGRHTIRDDAKKMYDGMKKDFEVEELTLTVSAHRKPTAHKFLPVVLCIRHALKDPGWQTCDVLKELASVMLPKLDKYWNPEEKENENAEPNRRRKSKEIELNIALVIATFLDPRRKEDYLDFFYSKVCSNEEQISKQVNIALDWVKKYVNEYELLAATSNASSTPPSQGNTTIGSPIAGKRKLEEEFAQHKSRRRSHVRKSKLDTYLEDACEEDTADFDVLAWWKRRAEKFPILSSMARDFLAIPLSTVASESAFSCGGRILGDTRSSLTPDMLQALVCAKDWLFIPKDDNVYTA